MRTRLATPIIAAAVAAVLSCGEGDRPQRSLVTTEIPDQVFADFTTMESDSGRVKWILKAPEARVYSARRLLVTDQPRISFYDDEGRISSVLTADKGEYNQVTQDLTALGNVVITTSEGYMLETESLIWLSERGEFHSEDFVMVTRGRDVLTGYGFTGYPELKDVDIKRDVRAYLRDTDALVEREVRKERDRTGDAE